MFYFYTIVVPAAIALAWYALKRPVHTEAWIGYFFGLSLIVCGYSILAYLIEMYTSWLPGWVTYTLWFFLVPAFAITLPLKVYFWWQGRRRQRRQNSAG